MRFQVDPRIEVSGIGQIGSIFIRKTIGERKGQDTFRQIDCETFMLDHSLITSVSSEGEIGKNKQSSFSK